MFDVLGAPVEPPVPVGGPDDGGNEEPEGPADGDEAVSDDISEGVEAAMEEEVADPVTYSLDELEGPSLTPLDAELVGILEMALFDAELGDSVMETLRLSLLLGLGIPEDSVRVDAPGDETGAVPPEEVEKPEVAVPELEFPDAVIDASVLG